MILLSDGWWEVWGIASQWDIPRDVSDHCALILMYFNRLWGSKPFRFNNHWLSIPQLYEVILKSISSYFFPSWKAFTLKEILKLLKWPWNYGTSRFLGTSIPKYLILRRLRVRLIWELRGIISVEEIDVIEQLSNYTKKCDLTTTTMLNGFYNHNFQFNLQQDKIKFSILKKTYTSTINQY